MSETDNTKDVRYLAAEAAFAEIEALTGIIEDLGRYEMASNPGEVLETLAQMRVDLNYADTCHRRARVAVVKWAGMPFRPGLEDAKLGPRPPKPRHSK